MSVARNKHFAWVIVMALVACGNDGDSNVTNTSTGGGGHGAAAAGGDGGSSGSAGGHPNDPCQLFADRATCCAQDGCGWHENIGHTAYFDVGPCVSSDLVCEVDGMKVRDCPEGMICHVDGGWSTEDDCAALPPPNEVNLDGRGLCVWPNN